MSYIIRYRGEIVNLCGHKHRTEEAKKKCNARTLSKLKQLEESEKLKGGASIDSDKIHGQAD